MRARLLNVAVHELWEHIEHECGPLDDLTDDQLRHQVTREASISDGSLSVPPVIGVRILADVLAKCLPNAAPDDRRTITDTQRLLRKFRQRIRRRRPFKRPRHNWFERSAIEDLCRELKELTERKKRQRLLNAKPGTHEHVAFNAKRDAAREIAVPRGIAPGTLLSWAANPGRRRRRPRK